MFRIILIQLQNKRVSMMSLRRFFPNRFLAIEQLFQCCYLTIRDIVSPLQLLACPALKFFLFSLDKRIN